MRCKHISISKTFHWVKPKYLSVSSLRVYHCVCGCSIAHTNMVLCCWRFTSGSLSSVLNGVYVMLVCVFACVCGVWTLFLFQFECYPCCWRNYGCVWSITERKCHGSSQIHIFFYAWSVHVCITQSEGGYEKATTQKNRLVQNLNALATCCAIEFVFCTCGWCVNSLWLQIQVIFNTFLFSKLKLISKRVLCVSNNSIWCVFFSLTLLLFAKTQMIINFVYIFVFILTKKTIWWKCRRGFWVGRQKKKF